MRLLHNETFSHYNGVIAVVTNTVGSLKENHLRTVIKLQIFFLRKKFGDATNGRVHVGTGWLITARWAWEGSWRSKQVTMVLAPNYPVKAETGRGWGRLSGIYFHFLYGTLPSPLLH